MHYDVVIIGSGLAGMNAALHAVKYGKVLLVCKGKLQESNSRYAQGGIAGVFEKKDRYANHINDTLTAGGRHNKRKVVEYFVHKAPEAIRMLEKIGVPFEHATSKTFDLHREAGHGYSRIVHVGDHTGKSIIEVLAAKIRKEKKITIMEETFASDLLVEKNSCIGVTIIQQEKEIPIYARRTILATGGCGQLFQYTTNPALTTGDGIAMAARAGCKIQDLEFVQFHPTALKEKKSPMFLLSETLRGAGAQLINKSGERFMYDYHHDGELAPRDIVSRAIYDEQQRGTVYLDIRTKTTRIPSKKIRQLFPSIHKYLKEKGYNMATDLIPVTPAAHYLCGGVITDVRGKTSLKNLYAIGEVACTGFHGANRLASNSLLEAAIMSEHVMDDPLPSALQKHTIPFHHSEQTRHSTSKVTVVRLKKQLQQIMWTHCGIIRTKKLLKDGRNKLKKITSEMKKLTTKSETQELQNMVELADLMLQAAQKRTRSLGAHYRKN